MASPPPVTDLISSTFEDVLVALARGIAEAQAALDAESIRLQQKLDEDPQMAQYGITATWYQMPNTQVELKVALDLHESAGVSTGPGITPLGPRLRIAPINARYLSQFSYDAQAASTVNLTIVPVPPAGASAAAPPTRTEQQIMQIAGPLLKQDDPTHPQYRLSVNYNPQGRVWYVIQSLPQADQPLLQVLVKVDDVTGAVVKTVTGS